MDGLKERIFKLRDKCTEKRLDDLGGDVLGPGVADDAKTLFASYETIPSLSVGPRTTYNELAEMCDRIISAFQAGG